MEIKEERAGLAASARRSRQRRTVIFSLAIIINGLLLVTFWFTLLTPAASKPGSNAPKTVAVIGDVSSPLIGKPAPNFALPALNRGSTIVHLTDFKGQVVMLNFWQSSCDPCNTEAPFMQKAWTQIQSKGVVFIGIDVPDTSDAAHAFLHKYGTTYLNVEDTLNSTTALNYEVNGLPETYFIAQNGVVAAKWIAPLNPQGLQLELAKLHIKLAIK
jgi:cytochrome c biogenesis protein CcmG, thiol:disulfide interchange protein DsbE